MQETAYAKLNLALHVRGRGPDGYHNIETVFAFAEDGDVLHAENCDQLELKVQGPFAAALGGREDNLVLKAAQALRDAYAIRQGAAITLEKNLPVASGLGGGSADAAATLRLLARLWDIAISENALIEIARGLGADVPACIGSRVARGEGRGDTLIPLDGARLAGKPLLLVNPGVQISTPAVFAAWDGVDRGGLSNLPPLTLALIGRNDLEAPACRLAPLILEALAALEQSLGATLARMSGSGATAFAIFGDCAQRDAAADVIAAEHPQWWQLRTRFR